MAIMFAFFNPWNYFTCAYYVKLLLFFSIALYYGQLSMLKAVWLKVKNSELRWNCSSTNMLFSPSVSVLSTWNIISWFHFISWFPQVWQKATSKCCIISVSLNLFIMLSISKTHIQTTCNMAFLYLSLWVFWCKISTQSIVKSRSCLLLIFHWSASVSNKPSHFMYIFIWRVVRDKTKKYEFSLILNFNNFLLTCII